MSDIDYRIVDLFPEPAFSALVDQAFSDYRPSALLTEVANAEAAARSARPGAGVDGALRIGAFDGDTLVGWTFASAEGGSLLTMVNSGVAPSHRRRGIYSALAQRVLDHATARGCVAVLSRHSASNNAVIIAKLRLGFLVSGFEYSEVYGPLVRLTYLVGELRRSLYQDRAVPIRRARHPLESIPAPADAATGLQATQGKGRT